MSLFFNLFSNFFWENKKLSSSNLCYIRNWMNILGLFGVHKKGYPPPAFCSTWLSKSFDLKEFFFLSFLFCMNLMWVKGSRNWHLLRNFVMYKFGDRCYQGAWRKEAFQSDCTLVFMPSSIDNDEEQRWTSWDIHS